MRKDLVRALAPFLSRKRLRRKDHRDTLKEFLSGQMHEIVKEDGSILDDDLRDIFQRVHAIDFDRAQREGLEETRLEMEEMLDELGIEMDLSGLRAGMTRKELEAKIAELSATIRDKAEAAGRRFQEPERRKSKRQVQREERMRDAEDIRKRSITTIYRDLAKALHPDLEPDPERRQRKVVLMQELTVAYRKNDLHTLLRLEVEWIQHEQANVERLTAEKLAVYNQALKDQVRELEREVHALHEHPRYAVITVLDGPFRSRMRTNGPAEAQALDEAIGVLEACIARLQTEEALHAVHEIIQTYTAASSVSGWDDLFDDEDLPF